MANIGEEIREIYVEPLELPVPGREVTPAPAEAPHEHEVEEPVHV